MTDRAANTGTVGGANAHRITVELDERTVRVLAALGDPADVLERLAAAAAEGVGAPSHELRGTTDRSLSAERNYADASLAGLQAAEDSASARAVQLLRQRADEAMQRSLREGTATGGSGIQRALTSFADQLVADHADSDADRHEGRRIDANDAEAGRGKTDRHLTGERAVGDSVLLDQCEANQQLIGATIRAQELTDEAVEARNQAEQSARELRLVAEFREMFIGILGHDLRTPLGSIVTAAAMLLRKGNLDEHDGRTASRILRSSQRITQMINQLLDLTRARLGGGFPLDLAPADLHVICHDVADEFESGVEVEVAGDVTGTWDASRLEEVLSNLTGNALEYAEPGTPVRIYARAEGPEVVVEVINRGEPIPAGVMPFIFEPFRRARQHEKSEAGNLGLGLYIAQQIAVAHGGTLSARSADGTTTFTLRLPRAPAGAESANAPQV